MQIRASLTRVSRNSKTGPIPVSTTEAITCSDACPFKAGGCYAKGGPLAIVWRNVETKGKLWADFCGDVAALPKGQLWRHNQAGDLAGIGDIIDSDAMRLLIAANKGRKGFTYTHKPMDSADNRALVQQANASGFTVNLSANNPAHADELAELAIGPVVCVLPADATAATKTPQGRTIAICPATINDNVNCANCGICQIADRKAIIGFPAHGAAKRKADAIANA